VFSLHRLHMQLIPPCSFQRYHFTESCVYTMFGCYN